MGLQYSITAIGSVILQTAVNSLGSQAVAAVTAAGRISGFSCCPFDALGSTMATYAGQNVGAGKLDRVGKRLEIRKLHRRHLCHYCFLCIIIIWKTNCTSVCIGR